MRPPAANRDACAGAIPQNPNDRRDHELEPVDVLEKMVGVDNVDRLVGQERQAYVPSCVRLNSAGIQVTPRSDRMGRPVPSTSRSRT